jgi:hypothetical protein
MPDNSEIELFYQSWQQDLKTTQLAGDEGGHLEQIFTQKAVDLLAEAGETENVRIAYDENSLGTKSQHKINAYSIADNYETVDLFISIYKGTLEIARISRDEIDTCRKRVLNFLRKAVYKQYVEEIEESSPVFDFAHTLAKSDELRENLSRYNVIILTDGMYTGDLAASEDKFGQPVFFRVVDINYLYNISEKSYVPIEIDFRQQGFEIPCIPVPGENDDYQSYLAIISGTALASIYGKFGSRLLEQNVRSFLQFTGKINKGIRTTILEKPHMFLAFNNGIAGTAEEVRLEASGSGEGYVIAWVKDFQIVNGGQTTASIYHTFKKEKWADTEKISVPLKLSVIKDRANFNTIVSKISEYSNTQNKVSISDLSSNNPFHIEMEKLSRVILTQHTEGQGLQTRWFYERARGQYKNARIKEGITAKDQRTFDLKNPRTQVFSKEDMAKYINVCVEIFEGKKLVTGPHFVVRGGQKNYVQFMQYVIPGVKDVDNIYFEDLIAKAILFKRTEKIYGIKPNAIGDLRYVTVPYSIAVIFRGTDSKIDLYKIWRQQDISEQMKSLLYQVMVKVEGFIKSNAPASLYGEWAKKEECWTAAKNHDFGIDFPALKPDLEAGNNAAPRRKISTGSTEQLAVDGETRRIMALSPATWHKLEEWGRLSGNLSPQQLDVAFTLAGRVRNETRLTNYERRSGIQILELAIEKASGIFKI